ncbi:cupin domain-containing protein [Pseudomonas syringae pv. tagetis]|uniref:Cupin domain-containing protein n=1 Tax=Pseudomonas syringae pv. tagetis TaxID=129140 RepID=A0A0N8T3X7_9PSED|nr:cupin domain-containing protein [Pseudomonas syringae group genomosp. 7]KPY86824.1 Cupin family protein [Pseudomonas syringae pv. tagetis]UNB66314.1 cupin domain-containing protein [Pseudomonas syringae pv. tagetis]
MRIRSSLPVFAVLATTVLNASAADAPSRQIMSIVRNGEQASIIGAPSNFVGSARVDPLFAVRAPSRVSAGYVTFQPGARSNWRTHPLGQMLVVTMGAGWVQQEGAGKQVIKPGDVIWTPPGVKHWHGATSTTGVTHMAIQEALDDEGVEWLEPVTEAQYGASS